MSTKARAKKWLIAAILLSTLSLMAGCGKNDPQDQQPGVPGGGGQPLPPGYGSGGCIPISQAQIPFSGTGVTIDSANILGGLVPNVGQKGTMTIGGAPTGGPYQRQEMAPNAQGQLVPFANISMNVMVNGQNVQAGQAYGTTGTLQGFVQLSQPAIDNIMYLIQIGQIPINIGQVPMPQPTYNPYNPYPTPAPGLNPSQVCVSGIAINSGIKANIPGYLYATHVYLYLNNSQHGYDLYLSL